MNIFVFYRVDFAYGVRESMSSLRDDKVHLDLALVSLSLNLIKSSF